MPVASSIDQRGVATLLIDRAAKRNCLNTETLQALIAATGSLRDDASVRAVVLRSAGEIAFISGADISEMARLNAASARDFITLVHQACESLRLLPVPVVARIQGHVLGAGLELAAACDVRLAADTALFGMPEVQVGIPSVVEAALLPRLIGWGRANWLLLTGQTIDSARALAWGLIEQTAPAAELDELVSQTLDPILSAGPSAIRLQKALIREWESLPIDAAIARGIDRFAEAWESDEPARMLNGFLAQRLSRKPG